jgi:hypothetical protein
MLILPLLKLVLFQKVKLELSILGKHESTQFIEETKKLPTATCVYLILVFHGHS